ncbi:MAG: arylsulfatase, partial [Planctomycetota bacterium]|nr:arylsulfatase [Planctomycetota bacterium]
AAKIPSQLTLDGRSFLPQLQGRPGLPRDSIYMWYSRNGKVSEARAFARNQRFKLYETGQFYDIARDRLEQQPIDGKALTEEQRTSRQLLQTRIDRFAGITPLGGT